MTKCIDKDAGNEMCNRMTWHDSPIIRTLPVLSFTFVMSLLQTLGWDEMTFGHGFAVNEKWLFVGNNRKWGLRGVERGGYIAGGTVITFRGNYYQKHKYLCLGISRGKLQRKMRKIKYFFPFLSLFLSFFHFTSCHKDLFLVTENWFIFSLFFTFTIFIILFFFSVLLSVLSPFSRSFVRTFCIYMYWIVWNCCRWRHGKSFYSVAGWVRTAERQGR